MKLFDTFSFRRIVPGFAGACMLFTVAIFASSCKDDDDSPNVYMALTSGSFFFDPGATLPNTVTVQANTSWQVAWTPETDGVVVSPASGAGNGTFRVEDMPVGATIQVMVYHMLPDGTRLISNAITVARGPVE